MLKSITRLAAASLCVWSIAGVAAPLPAPADTTIRGGTYASTNFDGDLLVTRASSDPTFVRKALLDFDLTGAIPSGSVVQSAALTMTVHWGGAVAARSVGVFDVTTPFVASQATWDVASATRPWNKPGGDLGREWTRTSVPNGAGARAAFDVTALVRAAATASPPHARLALVDVDTLTAARDGYRDYFGSEATDPATRPSLAITTGPAPTPSPSPLPSFSRVFVIVMENKEFADVIGNAAAPYINSLASQYGLATAYTGVAHPSLPDYMALTGGQTFFTTDCITCRTPARHVVDQLVDSGRTWKAYMDSMPTACSTTDTSLYVQKHNPFAHYTDVVGDTTRCVRHVVPFTQFSADLSAGALANFVWITPDMCHDMHSCSVSAGDTWLSQVVPSILASPAFNNAVLFLLWDEGTTTTGGGGVIPAIVVSPFTPPGLRVSRPMNHYDTLRTIEDAWKLPPLGNAAAASALTEFFRP